MTTRTIPEDSIPSQLRCLCDRLNKWRATRRRGQRIPEPIWKAAVALAQKHGLNATAAALKLNYYDLQRRLRSRKLRTPRLAAPAGFIEWAAPGTSHRYEGNTLELVRASGARVILRLADVAPKELGPLVRLFLRQRL